ncbi:MAG: aminoglycoside 3-N-acetyltransferase [Anaerolineae bacterium]|nr:aminoglycoside 3-N-acetyltransferase [Anaerolineae bacterium]
MSDAAHDESLVTHSALVRAFQALGVTPGQIIMLHASVKSIGKIVGGPNVIIQALLTVLTSTGTLMMYAGWEDIPDFIADLPQPIQQIYYDEHPAFDPQIARSVREYSILAEFLRTWPGAQRSENPEASIVAVGAQAAWITQGHPLNYGYGVGSPLAKLVELNGHVLMLGAPLDTITLLHYAEFCANMPHKNVVHYQCPVLRDGEKVWIELEDYDTGEPHGDYTFATIAQAYLQANRGRSGKVGNATSYLFDATDLAAFAVHWLENHSGSF